MILPHSTRSREGGVWGGDEGQGARGHVEQDIIHFISATQAFVFEKGILPP